jgi:hypothetical protein
VDSSVQHSLPERSNVIHHLPLQRFRRRGIRGLLAFFPIVALVLACGASAGGGTGPPEFRAGAKRLLFIGNSLTYVNDLPAVVAALGAQTGDDIGVHAIAFPDYSLDDHWAEGSAARALRNGKWEIVVMQQGPSSLPENQVLLAAAAERYAPLIRAAGAEPALYMVWPAANRSGDFDRVRDSYARAATRVQGLFLPAGEAWRAAWAREPNLALYGVDGFHPSPLGTLLAALVIYEKVTGKSCIGLAAPARIGGAPFTVAPATLQLLEEAAHETNARPVPAAALVPVRP